MLLKIILEKKCKWTSHRFKSKYGIERDRKRAVFSKQGLKSNPMDWTKEKRKDHFKNYMWFWFFIILSKFGNIILSKFEISKKLFHTFLSKQNNNICYFYFSWLLYMNNNNYDDNWIMTFRMNNFFRIKEKGQVVSEKIHRRLISNQNTFFFNYIIFQRTSGWMERCRHVCQVRARMTCLGNRRCRYFHYPLNTLDVILTLELLWLWKGP